MSGHILSAANQIAILFILMGAGCLAAKAGWMDRTGAAQMTKLVHFLATPCVILHAFLTTGFTAGMLKNMGYTAVFAAVAHLLGIGLARLLFRREPQEKKCVYHMCTPFSNCGFMGIPLVGGVFGADSVVYVSVYVAVFNLFTWTYGVSVYHPKQKASIRNMFLNPGTLSLAAGLAVAALQYRPPSLIGEPVRLLSMLNSPIAMIILGYYLAVSPLRPAKGERKMWLAILLKLAVVPGILFGFVAAFSISGLWVSSALAIAAMPCAVNVLLFTARFGGDTALAARTASYCTLLSILTMPLFFELAFRYIQ